MEGLLHREAGCVWSVIFGTFFFGEPADRVDLWDLRAVVNFNELIIFVVPQAYVEPRQVALDKIILQHQAFQFARNNDIGKVGDLRAEPRCLDVSRPPGEVRAHAASEALRFADVDHFARRVFEHIHAGFGRKGREFFVQVYHQSIDILRIISD